MLSNIFFSIERAIFDSIFIDFTFVTRYESNQQQRFIWDVVAWFTGTYAHVIAHNTFPI